MKLELTWVPGHEPALVFLHGLGTDGRCFRGALNAPGLRGRALLIPDLPGFGRSPLPEEFLCTMDAYAEHLMTLCRQFKLNEIAICAHSMGGAVGIIMAEKWRGCVTHFANAVGNLIPEDCFFSRPFIEMGWEAFESHGFQKFKDKIESQPPHPNRPPSTYLQSLQKTSARAMYLSGRDLVRLSVEGNLLSRFLALPCKKLYLADEDNPIHPHLKTALEKSDIPVTIIPNTGHALMEDNPADFYGVLADFLNDN